MFSGGWAIRGEARAGDSPYVVLKPGRACHDFNLTGAFALSNSSMPLRFGHKIIAKSCDPYAK